MKKILKLSLFAMLALIILAACTSNESTETDIPSDDTDGYVGITGPEPEPIEPDEFDWRAYEGATITIGTWHGNDTEEESLNAVIATFTEKTGIAVERRDYTDINTQLQTELAGGTAPDVFYVNLGMAQPLIESGALASLDNFIAGTPEFDQDDFFAPALGAFSSGGSVYGLPKDMSTLGLIYNVRLLEEAGFTAADIPDTMEEFAVFLRELNDALPDGVIAADINGELSRHMFAIEAGGTSIIDADQNVTLTDASQLNYLEILVDLYQDGVVQRPSDLGIGWSGDTLGTEAVAMSIEGNWVLGHLANNFGDIEFGTRELPTVNGQNGSMMFTVAWGMNANASNQGAAWKFIHFITGTEGMAEWAGPVGVIPTRASAVELLNFDTNVLLAPFAAAASYATPEQLGTVYGIVATEYNNFFGAALTGEMTLPEAMERAEDVSNSEIDIHMR